MDQELENLNQEIIRNPKNADAYFRRGTAYLKKEEWDEAIADFDTAIKLGSQSTYTYIGRGGIYLRKQEWDKAIEDFDTAIKLNSQNPSAYIGRGHAYFKKEEWSKAIADFDRVINFNIQNFHIYCTRGLAHFSREEWSKAIADFDKAIKLDAQNWFAYIPRGFSHFGKANWSEAFRDFVKAKELGAISSSRTEIYVASQLNDAICNMPNEDKDKIIETYFRLTMTIEKIKEKLFDAAQGTSVAHYTSLDTLKSIFSHGRFRLYNSSYMNDPEEGRVFFEMMKDFEEDLDLDGTFYGEDKDIPYRSPAYIGSFIKLDPSEDKDKLFLWRTYGKHKGEEAAGGCLIFPSARFAKRYLSQVGEMWNSGGMWKLGDIIVHSEGTRNDNQSAYEVVYMDKDKEMSEPLSKELLRNVAQYLKEAKHHIENIVESDETKGRLKKLVRELLDSIRFLFKASHYKEEREVRVLQFRYSEENTERSSDEIKIDIETIPPRFYLETPEGFRCSEVILGPRSQHFQEWKQWIEEQSSPVNVERSKIKYGNPYS